MTGSPSQRVMSQRPRHSLPMSQDLFQLMLGGRSKGKTQ